MTGFDVFIAAVFIAMFALILYCKKLLPNWLQHPALYADELLMALGVVWWWGIFVQIGYMHATGYNLAQSVLGALVWPLYWLGSLGVWLAGT